MPGSRARHHGALAKAQRAGYLPGWTRTFEAHLGAERLVTDVAARQWGVEDFASRTCAPQVEDSPPGGPVEVLLLPLRHRMDKHRQDTWTVICQWSGGRLGALLGSLKGAVVSDSRKVPCLTRLIPSLALRPCQCQRRAIGISRRS